MTEGQHTHTHTREKTETKRNKKKNKRYERYLSAAMVVVRQRSFFHIKFATFALTHEK